MSGEPSRSKSVLLTAIRRRWQRTALLRELLSKYRRFVVLGLGALILVDILEVLPPILLKQAVDVVVDREPIAELGWIAGFYLLVAVAQGFCRYAWRIFLIRSSHLAARDLRNRYSRRLFGLSPSFFDRRKLGDLMSLATNDVEAVRMALGPGLLVAADAIFYFVTVPVAMFWLSPQLTLLAFLPLPFLPWFVARNERLVHERFEKVQASFGRLSAMAQEALSGMRVIKAFAAEKGQLDRFRRAGEEYMKLNMSFARVQSSFGPTLDFTMSLGLVVLIYVGGHQVMDGAESLGTFVAFQRYIQKMVWPMAAIGMAISYLQRGVASGQRIQQVLAETSEIPDVGHADQCADAGTAPTTEPATAPRAVRGEIEFRNLSFRYSVDSPWVLREFSLQVPAGARVAFVGAVGSGKSTLLSLVPRLYPVEGGRIFIDGGDINDLPLSTLRREVGFVGQELFLFSETVRENLAWGVRGELPEERVDALARSVALEREVERLPQGWQTLLGERGVNLSGGQRQRLTIARALAREPAILILDDALSAIDTRTESLLLGELRSGRCTQLVAAHRLSTIQDADWIVVLEAGVKVQEGTHSSLLGQRSGLYRKFYDQQRLEQELEQVLDREWNEEVARHGDNPGPA